MDGSVLIVSASAALVEGLLRLVAAADATPFVAGTAAAALPHWRRASVVLVGADLAAPLRDARPPRRAGVLLVADAGRPDPYRLAVELGAADVVALPEHEERVIDLLAAEPGAGRAPVVCVVGGRGGAGASTLAALLGAAALRQGRSGLLVDGDPLGGGVDLVLGREQAAGARWPEFLDVRGRLGADALRRMLPAVGGRLSLLSWHRDRSGAAAPPIPAAAMRAVLEAAVRAYPLVIVDLPRHLDEAAAEALRRADATLLLVPLEVRAVAAAQRVAAALLPHTAALRMVARGPSPGGLTAAEAAAALELPLAGELREDRRLSIAAERGTLPSVNLRRGPVAGLCNRLLRHLDELAVAS